MEVVEAVLVKGGRFLEPPPTGDHERGWTVVAIETARQKVAHSLQNIQQRRLGSQKSEERESPSSPSRLSFRSYYDSRFIPQTRHISPFDKAQGESNFHSTRPQPQETSDRIREPRSYDLLLGRGGTYENHAVDRQVRAEPTKPNDSKSSVYSTTKNPHKINERVREPSYYDVLLGHGRAVENHAGNQRFHGS
jgi:hypothetical protein